MSTVKANNEPVTTVGHTDVPDLTVTNAGQGNNAVERDADLPSVGSPSVNLSSAATPPVDHPTTEQLSPILAELGETVHSISHVRSGLSSNTYRVHGSSHDYLLKLYPPDRSYEEVDFEASVLDYLSESQVAAEQPVHGVSTDLVVNGRPALILNELPGSPCARADLSPQLVYNTGAYLASVQAALRTFTPVGNRPRFDVDYVFPYVVEQINRRVGEQNVAAAERLNRMLVKACENFIADDLPIGVVHGDLYPANLYVDDDDVIGLTGFDDAYVGTMLFDLATAAMEFSFDGIVTLDENLLAALIAGYESPGQRIDLDLLIEAMWFSCFRYFGYTLEATSGGAAAHETAAGKDWRLSTHYRRLELLSHDTYRQEVASRVRKLITDIEENTADQ